MIYLYFQHIALGIYELVQAQVQHLDNNIPTVSAPVTAAISLRSLDSTFIEDRLPNIPIVTANIPMPNAIV
jgi:hypothetical protein